MKMFNRSSEPALSREAAARLTKNFKSGAQPDSVAWRIRSGGLHDISKIMDLLEAHDLPVTRFDVVPRKAAARQTIKIDRTRIPLLKRPGGADHYIFNIPLEYRPEVTLHRFEDVYLSFDVTRDAQRAFYLFDSRKRLINGLFFGAQPFLDPEMGTIETPTLLMDDFFVKPNICHFLFDKMPRWDIARRHFGPRDALLFHDFRYARDVLDLLDIPMTALAAGQKRGTVRLRDLVVFTNSFLQIGHPGMIGGPNHVAALDRLRDRIYALAGPAGPQTPRRYMLDRAPGLPRNITNRDEVNRLLQARGVRLGDPATLSPRDQLMLFAHVDLLIGVHGAGLTNLAYQPRGARVIELLPPLCATRAYWIMGEALGQNYDAITCHDPELGAVAAARQKHDGSQNRRDVVVPIDELEARLDG